MRKNLGLRAFLFSLISVTLLACQSGSLQNSDASKKSSDDEFVWLEDVKGVEPMKFAKTETDKTLKELTHMAAYKSTETAIRKILLAKDRLPIVYWQTPYVYNFWQDDKNVRGLWRRTSLAEYKKKSPKWETVLDIDQLAKNEKENWVYKGAECLQPAGELCLLRLSRGGKDAVVLREFNTTSKTFVKDGFLSTEAKQDVIWIDSDNLIIASDFGPETLTASGYARSAKHWKRGQSLADAKKIFEIKKSDMGVDLVRFVNNDGAKTLLIRRISFFEDETFALEQNGDLKKIQKPNDASVVEYFNDTLFVQLRTDWAGETPLPSGSLVALPKSDDGKPSLVFKTTDKQSIKNVSATKDSLIISYLDQIQGKATRAKLKDGAWKLEQIQFPGQGDFNLLSVDRQGEYVFANFESFLTPPSIYLAEEKKVERLKTLPARFDASKFTIQQFWAKSKDGTEIPYFRIGPKKFKSDGSNKTLIYGYGGFEVSISPSYLAVVGRVWLERGGTYIVANIRGGGEFGPKWHQAALQTQRQKAYDDFVAVAEDTINKKYSNPKKMAIIGGSNGGLLVGATYVQRPDLYKAVICQVPLLDMMRYNQLLAGASWVGEYGDPMDPQIREAILKYSPYQNLKPEPQYPEVFFLTSTMDDRVHPGHARKMVAKMKAFKKPYLYYENSEGGHAGAANLEQRIKMQSLIYTFLSDRL